MTGCSQFKSPRNVKLEAIRERAVIARQNSFTLSDNYQRPFDVQFKLTLPSLPSLKGELADITVDRRTAGQRIVSMEADAIVAEAFEQFRFDRTRDRVVHSLVDAPPYPSVARGYFPSLRHLPRAEIAEAELLKQAFGRREGQQRAQADNHSIP